MDDIRVSKVHVTQDSSREKHHEQKQYCLNVKQHIIPNILEPELLAWKRGYEGVTKIDIKI
jgi:hypothetical protein